MSWRLKINHVSGYCYQSPVKASYNEARITPLTTHTQTTIDSRVDIHPGANPYRYWDYWGTLVHAFDIQVPHTALVVTGSSIVETSEPAVIATEVGWDDLAERSEDWWEYLVDSRYVRLGGELPAIAEGFRSEPGPLAAATRAAEWVRTTMAYMPGSTKVSTSAAEALDARRGVCQDFAQSSWA